MGGVQLDADLEREGMDEEVPHLPQRDDAEVFLTKKARQDES
jgi:hypothetical protein